LIRKRQVPRKKIKTSHIYQIMTPIIALKSDIKQIQILRMMMNLKMKTYWIEIPAKRRQRHLMGLENPNKIALKSPENTLAR
jgi:tetrahydrodipicolinate N-succinyltransferase